MKIRDLKQHVCLALVGLVGLGLWHGPLAWAATTTNVSVGDNFFSPASISIKVNDSVQWNWLASNFASHSSTGPGVPPLWDTGIQAAGFTFTRQFTSAGTFPYHCTVHAASTGTVAVVAANVPPSVSLTAPTNGATFAAPWTGAIRASDSDSDGTVSKVDFFAGTTHLGTVLNPPATVSFTVTNLAAGNYSLTGIALDNGGASRTSTPVAIKVVSPVPIVLSLPQMLSPTSFRFSYTAVPGLNYAVRRTASLPAMINISTNTATNATMSFQDNNASGLLNFYSIQLLPNP